MGDFGANSFVVASHTVMVLTLAMFMARLFYFFEHSRSHVAVARGMFPAFAMFLWAIVADRAYYILARLMQRHGVDLWQLHPVPELLSLLIAVFTYGAMVPLITAQYPTVRARGRIGMEVGALALGWSIIAWVLH